MSDTQYVLVVEDSEADRFFLRRMLKKCAPAAEVVEFAYAEDALSYLKSANRPTLDAIFVDINMPRMSGFEFAAAYADLYPELRADSKLWIMSHSIDPRDRARAENMPSVNGFLSKSYDLDDLASVLEGRAGRQTEPLAVGARLAGR